MDPLYAAEVAKEALALLRQRTARLAEALLACPAWPAVVCVHQHGCEPRVASGASARKAAATAVRQVDYHDDQDARRVVRFVGALAVDTATLQLAQELNEAKSAFAAAIQQYRRVGSRRERDSHRVRELLIRCGAARLSLVQAYRHVPVLAASPCSIGFTWITRATQVTPRPSQLHADDDCSADQEHPPEVDRVAPHVRANVVWSTPAGPRASCLHAPLPILYPHSDANTPRIRGYDRAEPDPKNPTTRKRRVDAGKPRRLERG